MLILSDTILNNAQTWWFADSYVWKLLLKFNSKQSTWSWNALCPKIEKADMLHINMFNGPERSVLNSFTWMFITAVYLGTIFDESWSNSLKNVFIPMQLKIVSWSCSYVLQLFKTFETSQLAWSWIARYPRVWKNWHVAPKYVGSLCPMFMQLMSTLSTNLRKMPWCTILRTWYVKFDCSWDYFCIR